MIHLRLIFGRESRHGDHRQREEHLRKTATIKSNPNTCVKTTRIQLTDFIMTAAVNGLISIGIASARTTSPISSFIASYSQYRFFSNQNCQPESDTFVSHGGPNSR